MLYFSTCYRREFELQAHISLSVLNGDKNRKINGEGKIKNLPLFYIFIYMHESHIENDRKYEFWIGHWVEV